MKLIQDNYEESYHESFFMREKPDSQRLQKRMELLLGYKQEGALLEVGAGHGGLLRQAALYFSVEGMDISRRAAARLVAEFGSRVRQADIVSEPLPAGRYDAIAIFNVLEHLPQPGPVLEKCHQALNAGGVMIGSMPNNYGLVGGIVTRVTNYFDRTHVSTLSPTAWRVLFNQAGFSQTDFFGEVTLGRNTAFYLRRVWWPTISFNLMFAARK